MSAPQNLYFIALIPPKEIAEEIQQMKYDFRDRYGSSHSLNAPPHITLLSPFRLGEEKEEEVKTLMKEFCKSHDSFKVVFNDFSTFPPRVIFVDIKKTEALMAIQEELEEMAREHPVVFNYNYDERPYHPHLTLAFKDLSKGNFHRAWRQYKDKNFDGKFTADKLNLLKHNGEDWEVVGEFELGV